MEENNDLRSETSSSHDTIEFEISRKISFRQRFRTILISTLCVLILMLLFYFSLPVFQCKSIKAKGNSVFSSKDLAVLSSNSSYKPLILLDEEKSEKELLDNSKGLISEAKFKTNGFTSSLVVKEEFPCASFGSVVYFTNGITMEEGMNTVSSLKLDEKRIDSIKNEYERLSQLVPTIHIKNPIEVSEKSKTAFLTSLGVLPENIVSSISFIQYTSSNPDTFYFTGDFVFEYNNSYYVLTDCMYDFYKYYFIEKTFFNKVLPSMENYVEENNLAKEEYKFEDDSSTIQVYSFKPIYRDGKVVLIQNDNVIA